MPPKKGKTTPKKAAAEPAASTTSRRGKEQTATAATDRPRRASSSAKTSNLGKDKVSDTAVDRPRRASTSARLPTTAKSAPEPSTASIPKKKRGRPAKPVEGEQSKKRSRWKGSKAAADVEVEDNDEDEDNEIEEEQDEESTSPKKRRLSQPKKGPAKPKGTPGRPQKASGTVQASTDATPPRRRGRPPKGGETTQVSADSKAAAEQLEDELQEEQKVAKPSKGRKAQPSGKGKAKAKDVDEDMEEAAAGEDKKEDSSSGQRYWLMKAEQEDRIETLKSGREFNTKFTIDDLRSKAVPEPWDGVRNMVAAKNMRNMKKGDLAFFYASGGKGGRTPGITGIMEIVKEHEPDVTAADEDAYGYVEKESDRAKWCVVHVEFRKKLSKPVSLRELQKYSETNGVLANMQVLKLARLSVAAVSEEEWNFVVDNLIDGYEDEEEAAKEVKDSGDTETDKVEVRAEVPTTPSKTADGQSETTKAKTNAKIPAEVRSAHPGNTVADAKTSTRSVSVQNAQQSTRQSSRQASRPASQPLSSRGRRSTSARPPSRGRSLVRGSRTRSTMAPVRENAGADDL